MKRVIVQLFPRSKYSSSAGGKTYFPRDRKKLLTLLGGATEVHVHTRVYARDTGVTLDLSFTHGSFGDEPPAEGARQFTLAVTGATPAMPYDGTSMPNLPDDGTFYVTPKMGMVDVQAKAAGGSGSIEFESWATLYYAS